MKIDLFFSINCFFLKEYDALNDVKQPFADIYKRFSRMYDSSESIEELIKNTINDTNNNVLFYKGLEQEVKNIGNNKTQKIIDFCFNYIIGKTYDKKSIFAKCHTVKIKMKDINSGKKKRLLCVLSIITVESPQKRHIWTLFPLLYDDFHN